MSQPPSPYTRSYSFTAWTVSNPNNPLPGNNVDQQLDYIATSLNATISRLSQIQYDDGSLKLGTTITAAAQSAANQAATNVYATNLSLLADKAEARANLELNQYYPLLAGDNLFIEDQSTSHYFRTFPSGVEQSTQHVNGLNQAFPGPLETSTYNSRKFRSSILFGTLQDTATTNNGLVPADISYRVDNLSFALMYAGNDPYYKNSQGYSGLYLPSTGVSNNGNTTTSTGQTIHSFQTFLLNKYDYRQLGNLPSIGNPLVSLRQLGDAVSTHCTYFDHFNIPTNEQKQFLQDLINPNAPYGTQDAAINNASGYTAGSFNTTYYPKEIKIKLKGVTYAVPARIVT